MLPLQPTRLGLGTAPLGGLYSLISAAQAEATVAAALEAGINLFDTAPLYGAGESERRLGRVLRGVPRDSYLLATKVGRLVDSAGHVHFAMNRDGVLRSIADSLERLRLDRIDLVHIHDPDDYRREALEEVLPLLGDLRRQGVIGAVGAGMNQWPMLAEFVQHGIVDCVLLAGRYTLLEQGALSFLELCQSIGVEVFLGGVYNSGILATGARPNTAYNYLPPPPEVLARVARLEAICAQHHVALPVAAVQFTAAHPAVASLIIGARAPAEIQAAVAALNTPTPAALWADLRAAGLIAPTAPTPNSS